MSYYALSSIYKYVYIIECIRRANGGHYFIHRSKSVVPVQEMYGLVQTLNLSSVEKFRATPICFTVISLVTGPSHVV